MPIDTAQGRENAAAGYAGAAVEASTHTADPGATGASEVTGGTPAYARKAITWVPGTVDGIYAAQVTFDIPAATDVTHVGLWDASGNFLDAAEAAETFVSQGTMIVDLTYTQT